MRRGVLLRSMMYALLSMLDEQQRRSAQFSLHRYIKCGLGICGACCIDPSGGWARVGGPVFRGSELIDSEFGRYRRGADGVRIEMWCETASSRAVVRSVFNARVIGQLQE